MKTTIVLGFLILCSSLNIQAQDKIALSKIEFLNHPYAVNGEAPVALEKTQATMKTKVKAFGYGGSTVTLEAAGTSSSIPLNTSNPIFVIKTGGNPLPELTLFKLKITKKSRFGTMAQTSLTGMKDVQGTISLNSTKIQDGVFKFIPAQPLEKGEYFIQNRSAGANGVTWEVFAFSII